jgi:hypothetical protein
MEDPSMPFRMRTLVAVLAIVAFVPPLLACQMSRSSSRIFASMASIWSISASFQSSFGGRGSADLDERYARDVAAVSAVHAVTPEDDGAWLRDVTRVAEDHGITDWESVDATWLGMGVGLHHAGLSEREADLRVSRVFGPTGAERTLAVFRAE